jgi:hypothetical protein
VGEFESAVVDEPVCDVSISDLFAVMYGIQGLNLSRLFTRERLRDTCLK